MATSCFQCGAVIQDGSSFCPQCGAAKTSGTEITSAQPQHARDGTDAAAGANAAAGEHDASPFSHVLLDDQSHLVGISGWLILVAIGLVLGPILILGQTMFSLVPVLFMARTQTFLQSHPAVHAIIIGEIATNLIMFALLLWVGFLFFTKKRAFPTFMIFYLGFQLAVTFFDGYAAFRLMPGLGQEAGAASARALLAALIWIPYLLISRRVKLTFVH